MARARDTYRGARRNACRGHVWPFDGLQLDPIHYKPTKAYATAPEPTTKEMWDKGLRSIRRFTFGRTPGRAA